MSRPSLVTHPKVVLAVSSFGLWKVDDNGPNRLAAADVGLEKDLEGWIERDPSLLEHGLTIVGRQFSTEAGPIDLLALDIQGRWVVIELKRGHLQRETVAQALDYAACIATLPGRELTRKGDEYLERAGGSWQEIAEAFALDPEEMDQREVSIYVVGTGRAPGLERMIEFLGGKYDVPITVVTFEVFQLPNGQRVMLRELTEGDTEPVSETKAKREEWTVEAVCQRADEAGIGKPFRRILQTAREVGLYARPYKQSIMYTPPTMRTRMLFTIWTDTFPDGSIKAYLGPEAFAEFYPVEPDEVEQAMQAQGGDWWHLPPEDVPQMLDGLRKLMDRAHERA